MDIETKKRSRAEEGGEGEEEVEVTAFVSKRQCTERYNGKMKNLFIITALFMSKAVRFST